MRRPAGEALVVDVTGEVLVVEVVVEGVAVAVGLLLVLVGALVELMVELVVDEADGGGVDVEHAATLSRAATPAAATAAPDRCPDLPRRAPSAVFTRPS